MQELNWGILSTAKIGTEKVVPAISRAAGCRVAAISSRDLASAQAAAELLEIPTAYGSYEALLADPAIDAVYNPLPNHLHAQWTIAAAEAGKHVLCEKPLAMNTTEARAMVAACEKADVLLMEAFMYRLHPSWEKVRALIAEDQIGRVRAVQIWFGYHNDDPSNIRNIAAFGGGALYDVGCYAVNASRLIFGEEPQVIGASDERHPAFGTDVVTSALLAFPSGGQASFTCSTLTEPDQRVHIAGESGRIEIEIPFNIPPDRETRIFVADGGSPPVAPDIETITVPAADQYEIQAARFATAVRTGSGPPVPIEDAVATMKVIDAIVEASQG